MKKRLFWLHHTVPEDRAQQQDPTSTSHTNSFEIDMTVALVQHLVRQGAYGPDDIAVITPYLGQLHRLRRAMQSLLQISFGEKDLEELEALDASKAEDKEHSAVPAPKANTTTRTTLLKSIRLATVDNFQGEEAKVVVISLVRSNNERRVGFLSTSNRINVLLSRAKHGMYLISNADTYENIPMWAQVITMLRDKENIGPILELQCPRHPDQVIQVSTPDHFLQFSPEGGCSRQCDRRLACGHACINRCHSQVLHDAVRCLEPCPRPKPGCDHPCKLPCGDPCKPKCIEILEKLKLSLPCGHQVSTAFCWQVQDPSSIICQTQVSKTVPGCDHSVTVPCYTDVTSASYRCNSLCGDLLPCGHACRSRCSRCKERKDGNIVAENHEVCRQVCNRAYTTCRHTCQSTCHSQEKCPPCSIQCEVRCSHSRCSKKCSEPCAPCAEQDCSSACLHHKCTMPCAAPCDWIPCSIRCEKVLSCGHQCKSSTHFSLSLLMIGLTCNFSQGPSLCGEACPDTKYCQVCCAENIKSTMVDYIIGTEYHEVNLDEDPCIFPDCGHFITRSSMDGLMNLKAHYEMSTGEDPIPIALSNGPPPRREDEDENEKVKTCPSCRGSLRNIARYGKIVRSTMLNEAMRKFVSWSHGEFLKLAEQLVDMQIALANAKAPKAQVQQAPELKNALYKGRHHQLQLIDNWIGNGRYENVIKFWTRIRAFTNRVRKEEQPLQRVADFVQHAIRQKRTTGAFVFDETALQVGGVLQASALSIKCELMIFTDFMANRQPLIALRPEITIDFTKQMEDCETLIKRAKAAHYPRQEVEGHIFFAQFCAFARVLAPEKPAESSTPAETPETNSAVRERLREQGMAHITAARELLLQYASTHVLEPDIEAAEKMLRDGVFYTEVSDEEMRAVYKAMASEFLGTGHWYRCANGHPFTIGECGMPMEQARCPECGAPVGGSHHQAVEGVTHATEIEDLANNMNQMGI